MMNQFEHLNLDKNFDELSLFLPPFSLPLSLLVFSGFFAFSSLCGITFGVGRDKSSSNSRVDRLFGRHVNRRCCFLWMWILQQV